MSSAPPPPPRPPLAAPSGIVAPPGPTPPVVAETGPPGALLVELLIYPSSPWKDHWTWFVHSHDQPTKGVMIHATGDVKAGFDYDVRRGYDLEITNRVPKRIRLQWIDVNYFDAKAMINSGPFNKEKYQPLSKFEESAYKIKPPEKSLNAATEKVDTPGKNKVTQRNCQTWIIESADQLVEDNILNAEVAAYLRAIKQ